MIRKSTKAARGAACLLVFALSALPGCVSHQSATRSVEVDVGPDVAFRAAAATLLDDRQVFDVSDRDAGLVSGVPAGSSHVAHGRTTFWITPLERSRSFVVLQVALFGLEDPSALQERLSWLLGRLRQRCLMGGVVSPLEAQAGGTGGAS